MKSNTPLRGTAMEYSDTICASATPPGGAIGVVRLSGPGTFLIADKVFSARTGRKTLAAREGYTLTLGNALQKDGSCIDEVVAAVYHAPHSYTGEDAVEFFCHGSAYIMRELTARLIEAGARMAQPGEFTQRAFINGKMDLSQAEAVADLIAADSQAAHRAAIQQLRGGFSHELAGLKKQLLHFVSLMELELDFSDHEDLVFADRSELLSLAREIDRELGELAATFRTGNAIKNGIPVAIVGETNAGKSTLLNTLVGEERAIVSNIHGTTRDTIEDTVIIDGLMFRFIDTAGLRKTADQIESIGISRAYTKMDQASIILWMIDCMDISKAEKLKEDIRSRTVDKALIILFNKSESLTASQREAVNAAFRDFECPQLFISARDRQGIDNLRELLITESRISEVSANSIIITNVRHYDCLLRAQSAIQRAIVALQSDVSGDLVSQDIRECIYHLSDIAGEVTTDDVLSTIFQNFCIGK